jgi:hypothetical protein
MCVSHCNFSTGWLIFVKRGIKVTTLGVTFKIIISNFVQSVITIWRMSELVWWEGY